MQGMVERIKLGLLEKQVYAPEGDQRCRMYVESWREADGLDERGRGLEVEVLWPATVEVRVRDVVRGRADVRIEQA